MHSTDQRLTRGLLLVGRVLLVLVLASLLVLGFDVGPLGAKPRTLLLEDGEGLGVRLEAPSSADQLDALVEGEGDSLLLVLLWYLLGERFRLGGRFVSCVGALLSSPPRLPPWVSCEL